MGDELQLWTGLDSSVLETDRSQSVGGEVAECTGLADPLDSKGVDGELRRAQELVALYEASQEVQQNQWSTDGYDLQNLDAVKRPSPFWNYWQHKNQASNPRA